MPLVIFMSIVVVISFSLLFFNEENDYTKKANARRQAKKLRKEIKQYYKSFK